MENIKVTIKPTDKDHIYNMAVSDDGYIDEILANVMSNLSNTDLKDFSIVNNNELYEQLLLRILIDLFIKNMKDIKPDYTYTVMCNYNKDNYRFTVRKVESGDNIGIEGIVYGLSMY